MAQRIETVPQPRYATAPLETTGATIVSTRRVMVPPIIQGVFKGQRDYSGTNLNYIKFQIADNEAFVDNKCLLMIADLTVYGPNAADNSAAPNAITLGRTYGNDMDITFDQGVHALFNQISIGSPQGLKFEDIQMYNVLGNIITLHTESSVHKERHLMNYSEFNKSHGKDQGLMHFTDQQWRSPVKIKVGEKTRIALRFDFSDYLQNMDLIPLFLLRNGLEITLYLESAVKVFYAPHGSSCEKDLTLSHNYESNFFSPYYISPGPYYQNAQNTIAIRNLGANAAGAAEVNQGGNMFSPFSYMGSNSQGALANVPCYSNICVSHRNFERILNRLDSTSSPGSGTICVPVSMIELNQIVWSGWARIDISRFAQGLFDDAKQDNQYTNTSSAYISTTSIILAGVAGVSDKGQENLENNSALAVPQLDVDKRAQRVAPGYVATSIDLTRYPPTAAAVAITVAISNRTYFMIPLFSYNDAQPIPYVNFPNAAVSNVDVANANNTLYFRGAQCIFHCGDAFSIGSVSANGIAADAINLITPPVPLAPQVENASKNAASTVLSLWKYPQGARQMRYQLENPQLLMDLIKPDADNFMRWQQAFGSPTGIATKYKKPIYRKLTFQSQSAGLLQIQLPINVRSLTGIMFVIQDPALDTEPNDLISCLMLANLSTFQNRRLTEQYVQVGGQQYPVYQYQMKPDGNNNPYFLEAHLLEAEKFFTVAGSSGFNCSLTRPMLKKSRNLLAGGWLGSGGNPISSMTTDQRCTYTDTSACVYSMNLAKDWVRPFTTGIDSSQAGSIALNLYFKDTTGVSNVSANFGVATSGGVTGAVSGSRTFNVHLFAWCDAVATLQETANLVRY